MAMNFVFEGAKVQEGDQCSILEGPPYGSAELAGEPAAIRPLQTVTINADNEANFTISRRENFGLTLTDSSGTLYARSNGRSMTTEEVSETISYYVLSLPQVIGADDIEDMLPEVPFTEGNITVDTLEVTLHSGFIRAAGTARYVSGIIRLTITFTYEFSLERVTRPYWLPTSTTAIVEVETEKIKVKGANFLQSIILFFFKGSFKRQFEDLIEEELTSTVNSSIASLGGNAKPTVEELDIDSDNVTMQINLWMDENPCPGIMRPGEASGKRSMRKFSHLHKLRSLRNNVLFSTEKGKAIYDLFEDHRKELFVTMLNNDELAEKTDCAVDGILEAAKKDGEMILSQDTVANLHQVLDILTSEGSEEVKASAEKAKALLTDKDLNVQNWLKGAF